MRFLTAALILALATWTAGAADDAKDAAKKLEGTYKVVSVTADGKPDPKKAENVTAVIKDGVITIQTGKKDEPAKFTLDPSKKPAQIDITPARGKEKTIPGIYATKETDAGLELTIAFGDGPNAERPKDFKGDKGAVITFLRKKEK